jgi:uncharacterized membrane protein YcaP (DUF421 family)
VISHDLATMGIPIAEKAIRTVAVYGGIAVLLRVGGKRDLAQLNTFDLVVMLLLSNVVQNAIIGPDNSLTGGLIGAAILVAINSAVVRISARNALLARALDGTPTRLIKDGDYDEHALHREGLRRAEVEVAIRRQGANSARDVAEAMLEPGGAVVVTLNDAAMPATRADIADLRALLVSLGAKPAG